MLRPNFTMLCNQFLSARLSRFFVHPSSAYEQEGANILNKRDKLRQYIVDSLWIYFGCILFGIVISLVASPLGEIIATLSEIPNPAEQLSEYNKSIASSLQISIFAIFVAPVLEELTFRYGLNLSKLGLVFSSLFSLTYLSIVPIHNVIDPWSKVGVISLFLVLFTGILAVIRTSPELPKKYKGSIVVIFSILFGVSHLFNIQHFHWQGVLVYLLTVLPIFYLGYGLAFIRIRYGLGYAVLLHTFNNGISILLLLGNPG